jgi:hypothetical protein
MAGLAALTMSIWKSAVLRERSKRLGFAARATPLDALIFSIRHRFFL